VVLPAGDDLGILKWNADDLLLVGTDQVLDGVHFDSSVHPPRAIGRKVMNRNLSDCAAMACLPAAAVVTLALPRDRGIDYAKEIYLGVQEAGDVYACPIVGGDTASWPGKLVATVTIFGRSHGIEPVRRSGAKPGDIVCVTGPLGGSIRGRHMTFAPRIFEARQIIAGGLAATAMLDLSDGLSRDLPRLCAASGVGAVVRASAIPVHEDAIELRRDGRSPVEHALHDGEDYELLFTCPVDRAAPMNPNHRTLPFVQIGTVTAEPGVWIEHDEDRREPLEPKGWDHSL
jgi:thiamine-monophosphate kinase